MASFLRRGIILIGLTAFVASASYAVKTIPCDNANIRLAPYVWNVTGSGAAAKAEAAMPGAYFKASVRVTSSLGIVIDGTANAGCPASLLPIIDYSIDDGALQTVQLKQTNGVYTISFAGAGSLSTSVTHKVEVLFRAADVRQNRWTTSASHVRFVGLSVDDGAAMSTTAVRGKNAICFGDSVLEGVGVDSWNVLGSSNARGSWFPLVCTTLGCEYGQLGSAGQGMVTSGNGVPPLPQTWDRYDAATSRLTNGLLLPEPDYVFCNMGTDEYGVDITSAYVGWIKSMRAACPNAPIFCVVPPSGAHRDEIQTAARTCYQAGDTKVSVIDTPSLNSLFRPASAADVAFIDNFSGAGHTIANADPDWIKQAPAPAWNWSQNWQLLSNAGDNAYGCIDAAYDQQYRGITTAGSLDLTDFTMEADLINFVGENWLIGHAFLTPGATNFLNFTGLIMADHLNAGVPAIAFYKFDLSGTEPEAWAMKGVADFKTPTGQAAFPFNSNKVHAKLAVSGQTWSAVVDAYDPAGTLVASASSSYTWPLGGATHGLVGIHQYSTGTMWDNVTITGGPSQLTSDTVRPSEYGSAMLAVQIASKVQNFLGSTLPVTIETVKSLPDASHVDIKGYLVTGAFSTFFYVESDDRTTGIRIYKPNHGVQTGMRVDVSGKVFTNVAGERYIIAE